MTEALFQYVPRDRFLALMAQGWTLEDDLSGTHHGAYSVLMRREEASDDRDDPAG